MKNRKCIKLYTDHHILCLGREAIKLLSTIFGLVLENDQSECCIKCSEFMNLEYKNKIHTQKFYE
jgi:hypothetical protein